MTQRVNLRWNADEKIPYRMASILGMALVCFLCSGRGARAQGLQVLLNVGDLGGVGPGSAGLLMDASGNLYGETYAGGTGSGTVFELVNSGGSYAGQVLYSFMDNGDGFRPEYGLVRDASGNLYGITKANYGNVFELVNNGGTYTEQALYTFLPGNVNVGGSLPEGGLFIDPSGNLFGTTYEGGSSEGGVVFELVNNGGSYTENVLYNLSASLPSYSPKAGLISDSSGNLFGTATGPFSGSVFELTNSSYSYQLLAEFSNAAMGASPRGNLFIDSSGNLYGTTTSGGAGQLGTVFELSLNGGTYSLHTLYSFAGTNGDGAVPLAGVVVDASGNVYGTTSQGGTSSNCSGGCGTLFELVNSAGTYNEVILHNFTGDTGDGGTPEAPLIMDASGNLYGTTNQGGSTMSGTCPTGCGIVFEFSPGSGSTTTTLTSSLNPATAGDSVSFTAALSPSNAIGTVTFSNGNTTLGTQTVSAGTATLSVEDAESLGIGTYTITAQYTPTPGANFQPSSGSFNQTINEPGVALTGSGNSFSGNQTIAGNLTATSLFGNGAGLTSLNPAALSSGTAGINITGNAATATTALSATIAATASALASAPAPCGPDLFAIGIAANGNASCLQPASTNLSDYSTLVYNNQANAFAGGKQTLAPSATGYSSLNLPNTGVAPSTPAIGDLWLTTADAHPKFQDGTNTTQSLAFLSDVSSTSLLGGNNTFTGTNTFTQTINGSISGNAATATTAVTATSAATATSALTATTAGSATTAAALAAAPSQCGSGAFATGIAANGNANCAPASTGIASSQILFSSAGASLVTGEFMGISAPSATEASVEQIVAVGGHVTEIQCHSQTPPRGSAEAFTLRLNGTSTAGVCQITAGSTKGSVTGLSLAVSAGNLLDLKVSGPATLGAATVAVAVGP